MLSIMRLLVVPSFVSSLVLIALPALLINACGDSDATGGLPDGGIGDPPDSRPDGGGPVDGDPVDGGLADSAADGGACELLGNGPLTFRWTAEQRDNEVTSVAAAPNGFVYALHVDGDRSAHVRRLDENGDVQWERPFMSQDPPDGGRAFVNVGGLAVDSVGRVVVAGTLSFGGNHQIPRALIVMRINEDGTTSYLKSFEAGGLDAHGVAIDSSNHVWVAGDLHRAADFGGGVLTPALTDGFLLKLDADGSHLFSRRIASSGNDSVSHLALGPQGGPVIAGVMDGSSDLSPSDGAKRGIFVASFDSAGALAWSNFTQSERGTKVDKVTGLGASPSSVVVLGQYQSTRSVDFGGGALPTAETGPPMVFAVRLGTSGQQLQARTFGRDPSLTATSDPSVILRSAAIDTTGNVFVAGSLYRSADFGLGVIPKSYSGTYLQLFLRFDASLNTTSSRALGPCAEGHLQSASYGDSGHVFVGGVYQADWKRTGAVHAIAP